jgi:type II secretory pathway predicted ATPase ExeA
MNPKLKALYGLKFNPFLPDIPTEAHFATPAIDAFCRRMEFCLADGGFAMITGDPGSGKSAAIRILASRLAMRPDLLVGVVERPVGKASDFYRELASMFEVPLPNHNAWGGFKALRMRWSEHIASTLHRPVLIIDEAQEMVPSVLTELRLLVSKDLDARSLLTVVFVGDGRLGDRFRMPELLPLGSRIRRRLKLEPAAREELVACLDHVLEVAGAPQLMSTELRSVLAEHAAGNYRVMMNLAYELLIAAAERELPRLDEKLFFDVLAPPPPARASRRR